MITDGTKSSLSPRARNALQILDRGGKIYRSSRFNPRTRQKEPAAELHDEKESRVRGIGLAVFTELDQAGLLYSWGNSIYGWSYSSSPPSAGAEVGVPVEESVGDACRIVTDDAATDLPGREERRR